MPLTVSDTGICVFSFPISPIHRFPTLTLLFIFDFQLRQFFPSSLFYPQNLPPSPQFRKVTGTRWGWADVWNVPVNHPSNNFLFRGNNTLVVRIFDPVEGSFRDDH